MLHGIQKKKNRKKANCHQTCTTVPLNHKTKETTVQEFYFLIKYLKKNKQTNKQRPITYPRAIPVLGSLKVVVRVL